MSPVSLKIVLGALSVWLLLEVQAVAAANAGEAAALRADDECAAGEGCGLNALQLRARSEAAPAATAAGGGAGVREVEDVTASPSVEAKESSEGPEDEENSEGPEDEESSEGPEDEEEDADQSEPNEDDNDDAPEAASLSQKAQGCKGVGGICWVNAQCCSGRCIRTHRCGPRVR